MMRSKSDARPLLRPFFKMVETQIHSKIKVSRTDSGYEFDMRDFFASKGTLHQLSCVERAQQNGVAKRKHQHILNIASLTVSRQPSFILLGRLDINFYISH